MMFSVNRPHPHATTFGALRATLVTTAAIGAFIVALAAAAPAQDMTLPEPVGMDGDPAARFVLDGNAAFMHGDITGAAADYHAALRRKPDFATAAFNLGLVEAHQGRRSAGLADMDRGIALATRHSMSSAYVNRLRALRSAFAAQAVST